MTDTMSTTVSTSDKSNRRRNILSMKHISRVGRILSRSGSESDQPDQDHLLEDEQPVATLELEHQPKNKKQEEENLKLKIPSSLVKLTDEEKRQLEDVLMRIGLKECGL